MCGLAAFALFVWLCLQILATIEPPPLTTARVLRLVFLLACVAFLIWKTFPIWCRC
jgi:hypothetical protein